MPHEDQEGYDNMRFGMNDKRIVVGSVGTICGFIFGFFVAKATIAPAPVPTQAAPQQGLPENHPGAEVVELLQQLQQRADENPKDAQVRVVLGNAYYEMKRFDAAIRWYEAALALEPDNISTNTDLGTAYFYVGNPSKALDIFNKSLQLDPNHPQTLQNIGVVNISMGNTAAGLQAWQKLLETNPDYPQIDQIREQIKQVQEQAKSKKS